MKKIFLLPVAAIILLLFSQCNDYAQGGTMKTYFWTHTHPDSTYYLYINNTCKGILPYQPKEPRCGAATLSGQTLFTPFTSGSYILEIKDKQGNIKFAESYKIRISKGHFSLKVITKMPGTGNRRTTSGDCAIEELYF
jgi:hypothetical protein